MLGAALAVIIIGFFLPSQATAGGPVHGAKAAGMGTSFVGLADDPSAILFNPAGLTQLKGVQAYGGVTALHPSTTYTNGAGFSETTKSRTFFPPHAYATTDVAGKDVVLGLGLYAPFGIGGRFWSETGLTRYWSVESSVATISLNPTVAWRATETVSLAAGIDYLRAVMRLRRMMDQSFFGASEAQSTIEADGDGWGYNFGALLRTRQGLGIGAAYRSRVKVDYRGDLTVENVAPVLQPLLGGPAYSSAVTTTSRFPDIWSVGASYPLSPALIVAADVELVRWSSFKRMDMNIEREAPPVLVDSSLPLDWDDSWQFKIGAEYAVTGALVLRAGYAFINTPVPDGSLEPGNPDADQHNLSFGAGYGYERIRVDCFYNLSLYRDRSVRNPLLSGTYENKAQYLGVSIGRTF